MKNILLATDLTVNADRAFERAIKLAKECKAKLHIIHVIPAYPFPKDKNYGLWLKEHAKNLIHSFLDNYSEAKSLDTTIKILQDGNAFAQILEQAHKTKADLIVMGTHNKTKFRDLFIGTTIERVIRMGTKPVLMVKNKPSHSYRSIVAGIDFAPHAHTALKTAMDIASNAMFRVIHAYEVPYYAEAVYAYSVSKNIIEEKQQKVLNDFLRKADEYFKKTHDGKNARITGKLSPGSVTKILLKEAKNASADLLVMGAHGRIGYVLESSKLGGTAEDILAKPPCDILVAVD